MSGIFVRGVGAVSPAGWGVEPLLEALRTGIPLPAQSLPGPAHGRTYRARLVPPPATRPNWLAHPRLRRASAISHFAMAAALEALGGKPSPEMLGIVTGTHTACIRYSERFYGEVLQNPATASPMLFPETVINAPASHLAAFLGSAGMTYSVVGDQTAFVQALVVACQWLLDGRVDACLVLGIDEAAWPAADALRNFSRNLMLSEGAGAVLLAREPGEEPAVVLECITDAHLYAGACTKTAAAFALRQQLPGNNREVLCDSRCGATLLDQAETAAWSDWPGARISPRLLLGEGLCAATAWQFVAAQAALVAGTAEAANVSVVGGNTEAIGGRLTCMSAPVSRFQPTQA